MIALIFIGQMVGTPIHDLNSHGQQSSNMFELLQNAEIRSNLKLTKHQRQLAAKVLQAKNAEVFKENVDKLVESFDKQQLRRAKQLLHQLELYTGRVKSLLNRFGIKPELHDEISTVLELENARS